MREGLGELLFCDIDGLIVIYQSRYQNNYRQLCLGKRGGKSSTGLQLLNFDFFAL